MCNSCIKIATSPLKIENSKVEEEKNLRRNMMCYSEAVPSPVLACPSEQEEKCAAHISPPECNDRQLSLAGR